MSLLNRLFAYSSICGNRSILHRDLEASTISSHLYSPVMGQIIGTPAVGGPHADLACMRGAVDNLPPAFIRLELTIRGADERWRNEQRRNCVRFAER